MVVRYSVRVAAPGCMALVLEAIGDRPPYQLENRTPHPLLCRPALPPEQGQHPAEFLPLPPWSCLGYAPAAPAAVQQVRPSPPPPASRGTAEEDSLHPITCPDPRSLPTW